MLKRRAITVGVLLAAGEAAVLAVPNLHEAARKAGSIDRCGFSERWDSKSHRA